MAIITHKRSRARRYAQKLAYIVTRMIKDPRVQAFPDNMLAASLATQFESELAIFAEEIKNDVKG